MKFLSNILFVLAVSFTMSVNAEIPNQFNSYSFSTGSVPDFTCRAIWQQYLEKYNSQVITVFKPGLQGILALKEMLNNDKFSVACTTSSDHVFNHFVFPEEAVALAKIKIVTQVNRVVDYFYTSSKEIINLKEFLTDARKKNKTLTVGYFSFGHRVRLELILRQEKINVNWVPFNKPTDMIAPLLDGSLHLVADGGPLMPLVKSGKLNLLGYSDKYDIPGLGSTNIKKDFPYDHLAGFISISVANTVSDSDVLLLNHRIVEIMQSPQFKLLCESRNLPIIGNSPKEAQQAIDSLMRATSAAVRSRQ